MSPFRPLIALAMLVVALMPALFVPVIVPEPVQPVTVTRVADNSPPVRRGATNAKSTRGHIPPSAAMNV